MRESVAHGQGEDLADLDNLPEINSQADAHAAVGLTS